MNRILNYGSLNIDYVYQVSHIVKPGETISAGSLRKFAGGKGLNQSIAMARAGAAVFHAGRVGSDGRFLREVLEEEGVGCEWLREAGCGNGSALIQKDQTGQNAIICFPGSNGTIGKDEIDEALEHFDRDDILVSQNEISNVPYLLKRAGEKGMQIAFNPSPADRSLRDLDLSRITWLIINETEGYELTGETKAMRIVDSLLESCPQIAVILTLGGEGSLFKNRDEEFFQAAFDVRVKDTTAAGDTFLGYFLGNYTKSRSARKAMEIASRAAGIAVTRDGAVPSIPYEWEVCGDADVGEKRS